MFRQAARLTEATRACQGTQSLDDVCLECQRRWDVARAGVSGLATHVAQGHRVAVQGIHVLVLWLVLHVL